MSKKKSDKSTSKKASGSATVANDSDSEDGVFMAYSNSNDDMPELMTILADSDCKLLR